MSADTSLMYDATPTRDCYPRAAVNRRHYSLQPAVRLSTTRREPSHVPTTSPSHGLNRGGAGVDHDIMTASPTAPGIVRPTLWNTSCSVACGTIYIARNSAPPPRKKTSHFLLYTC